MPLRARAPREGTPSGTEHANSARPAEDAPPCALPPRRRSRRGLGSHSRPSGASDAAAPPSQRCSARPAAPAGMTPPRTARVVDNLPMREILSTRSKRAVSVRVRGESALERRPTGRVWDVSCPRGATAAPHSRREAADAWGGEGAVSCADSWVGRGESRRAAGRNLANGCAAEGVWVDAGWVGRAARRTSAAGAARRAVRVTRQPFSSAEYGRRPVVHIRLSCRRAAMRAACLRRAAPLARQHQAAPCGARVRRTASAAAARGAALPHGLELLHGATLEGAKLRV